MGLLAHWLAPSLAAEDLTDDRWYGVTSASVGSSHVSHAGTVVSESTALTVSTVFRCVTLLGGTVGSLPIDIMRWKDRVTQVGMERAPQHPLARVLKVAPNAYQSSYGWRAQVVGSVMLRGNAYQRIIPGPRGFADQLMPIHVDRTLVEYLSGRTWIPAETAMLTPGGRLRYVVTPDQGASPEVLLDEEVLHLRGYTLNGLMGVSVLGAMRHALGLAQAVETFKSKLYAQGTRLSGVLKLQGALKPDALERLKTSWREAYSGAWNAGKVPVLENGLDFQSIGMNADDAQLLEAGAFQVEDLLRFLGIPGVLVGHPDKTATYASAEQFFLSFAKHCVEPWLVNLESELHKELIIADDTYFVRFDRNPLVRGDLLNRWNAHKVARETGAKTIDEIRQEEGLNPLEAPTVMEPPVRPGVPALPARQRAWMSDVVQSAAGRLVRKEIEAVTHWAPRFAKDPAGWERWLGTFYEKHAILVAGTLGLPVDTAQQYAGQQAEALRRDGVRVVQDWATAKPSELSSLAWAVGATEEETPCG